MENTLTYKLKFTWTIEHFSKLNVRKHYSKIFSVEGHKWRVLIYPKGNRVDHLSIYLNVADSAALPSGWSRHASIILAVVSQIRHKLTIKQETEHTFNAKESVWGFTSFIPLLDVHDITKGYLVNDTLIVEAEVGSQRVVDYCAYDSRKHAGFVGLKNQGATGQSEEASPSQSSEFVGGNVGEHEISLIHRQKNDEEDPPKRLEHYKRVEGGGEGEAHDVQRSGVLPKDFKGTPCRLMTVEQMSMVLRDITRGLVPIDLEDPRWPSSAGEMSQIFAPVVRLADEFKAMKEEVERQRTRATTLSESMKLFAREGGTKP